MIFTQEQIDEIEQKLAKRGAKDTQLPSAKTPLTGDENIAIVQERENRLVPIGSIVNTDGGIFNVSEYLKVKTEADTSVILTLSEALEACPNRVKKAGQIITFIDKDKEWQRYQYQGYNAENWNQLTLWKDLNNVSEDMPVSEDVMVFNITEYMPGGSKYKQSIWAGIYTIDGITPVSQYRVIFGCDENLGDVEGVDMDISDTLAIIDRTGDEVDGFSYILFVGNSIDGYRYQTTINSDEDVPDWIAEAFGNNSSYILANIASLERRVNAKLADKAFIVRVDDYLDSSKEMPNGYFMFEQQPVSQIRVLYDSDAYLLYIQAAVDGTGTMYFAFENFDEYYDSWRYLNQYTEENCPSHVLEAFGLNVATSNKKGMMSATDKNNLDGSFKNVSYNANTKKLIFTKNNNTTVELDATPFIKDGMVNSVSIVDGYLVITFNTDSGKETIRISLIDIFDLDDYYTKTQTDNLLGNKVDKEQGKGLSTNDYTDSDKEKVSSISLPGETYSISQNQWILDGNIATNSEGVLKIEATAFLTPAIVDGRLVLTRNRPNETPYFKIYSPFEGTLRIRCYQWDENYDFGWEVELGYLSDYPERYHWLEPFYRSSNNTDIAIYVKAGWNTIRNNSYQGPLTIIGISLQRGILALNSVVTQRNMGLMSPGYLTQLLNKVDKVTGKGLSTNDYTTADKEKLNNLPTATELTQELAGKANTADLAPVATSGNYDDLTGKPAVDNTPTPGSDNLVKSGGVYSTTPSIANTDAKSDLDVSDEDGNILMRLFGGHIKTKNFNSAEPVDLIFLADVSACKYSGNLMHIGFDDIYVCLTALFSQRPNSIYDITFFDNLRTLHNTYGACFSCYIYIESLENVTNTYANEFQAAKSWLRWNFHTHKNHVYNEDTSIESDYDLGITRLLTMVGNDKDCLDHELRGNMWELSLANAQYVRDNATHSSYIFFAKDAFSPSTGNYYLSEEQKTFVFNNGFLIDVKNRVLFIQTCARLDDNEKTAASKEYIAENIKWQKSCEVLNHERAFDYTRMDLFLDWAKNTMNFRFGFFDNIYKF